MAFIKQLAQKIRHPETNQGVELMYFGREDTETDAPPSIYLHGKLADKKVVEYDNLSQEVRSHFTHVETEYKGSEENLIISIS